MATEISRKAKTIQRSDLFFWSVSLFYGVSVFLYIVMVDVSVASAASRVFYDGFENGNTNLWIQGEAAGAEGKCDLVTSALDGGVGPKSGIHMARCNWDGTSGELYGHSHQQMDMNWSMSNEALIRFSIRVDNDVDVKEGSKLFRWNGYNSFAAIQFEQGNGATLYTRCHDDDGTQLGTTNYGNGPALRDGSWHQIELYIRKGAGGAIKIWIDNSLVWEVAGINTTDATWNIFQMMSNWSLNTGWEHDANNHMYWDEFEVFSDSITGTSSTGSMANGDVQVVTVFTEPTITNVSGTADHGQSITVIGGGFGTKATAAPAVWDNASGVSLSEKWDGYWPNCSNDHQYDLAYRTPIRGVALPHNRITKYLAGAHMASGAPGSNCGYNVIFWKYRTLSSFPQTTYASYYVRMDPNWVLGIGEPDDNNHKLFALDDGTDSPYAGQDTTNITHNFSGGQDYPTYLTTYDGGAIAGTTRMTGTTHFGNGANYWTDWYKIEIEYRHSPNSDGYIKMWEDGALVVNYSGRTVHAFDPPDITIGYGGYSRNYPNTNNWRYFADVYYDTTASRILLCSGNAWNTRGVCENQLPTNWNATNLSATVNLGSFTSNQTAYLYVVDLTGTPNPTGYPITIGGSSTPDTTPPTWPTGTTLSASATSQSSISVSWTASTDNVGVTGYLVERCQGSGCSNFAQVGTPTTSPFIDTGLTANTFYNYHVRATDAAGNLSGWSNVVGATTQAPDTQAPTAPSNLQTSVISSFNINLVWTASTDNVGVTGYKVERCSGSSCTSFTQIATPTATNYSDTGLSASTTYRYRVRATDAANNDSAYSTIASATTPETPPVSDSLMLGMNFNEGTGTTTSDVSGHNNTGTLSNTTWTTSGKYGNALSFNGTSSFISVPDSNSLDLTTGMTLSAWVYPTNLSSSINTVLAKTNGASVSYDLIANDDTSVPQIYMGGTTYLRGTSQLPLNAWTHLASTFDGSILRLFVNGVQVSSSSWSGPISVGTGILTLGNSPWNEYFQGRIDDVRIYNTALTQTEIQTDMNTALTSGGSGTVSCNTVTTSNFSQAAYNAYGAPYDLFAANAPLVDAKCTSGDPTTINATIGKAGDTTRIVYTKGYYYDPGITNWTQYTGTCTGTLNGDWCAGPVTATITDADISVASALAPAYLVGMVCSVQGGSWRCGCRDTTCGNFYWMIQGAGQ